MLLPGRFPIHLADFVPTGEQLMDDGVSNERYLFAGLIRLHLLHHAADAPFYGLEMIEELARHGYRLSAGTLYPLLHGLEERGLLVSTEKRVGRTRRRMYRATPAGRKALIAARARVRELFSELVEEAPRQTSAPRGGHTR